MSLTPQQQQFRAERDMRIYTMYQKGDKSSAEVGKLFGLSGPAVLQISKKIAKRIKIEAEIYKERMKEEKAGI